MYIKPCSCSLSIYFFFRNTLVYQPSPQIPNGFQYCPCRVLFWNPVIPTDNSSRTILSVISPAAATGELLRHASISITSIFLMSLMVTAFSGPSESILWFPKNPASWWALKGYTIEPFQHVHSSEPFDHFLKTLPGWFCHLHLI